MSNVKGQSKMKREKCPLDFRIRKSLTLKYAFVCLVLFCLFFNDGYGSQNGWAKK